MASQNLPADRPLSLLERAGVSRGWRVVAAVLIVVLSPVWLAIFLMGLALTVKVLDVAQDLAEVEAAWTAPRPPTEMKGGVRGDTVTPAGGFQGGRRPP